MLHLSMYAGNHRPSAIFAQRIQRLRGLSSTHPPYRHRPLPLAIPTSRLRQGIQASPGATLITTTWASPLRYTFGNTLADLPVLNLAWTQTPYWRNESFHSGSLRARGLLANRSPRRHTSRGRRVDRCIGVPLAKNLFGWLCLNRIVQFLLVYLSDLTMDNGEEDTYSDLA